MAIRTTANLLRVDGKILLSIDPEVSDLLIIGGGPSSGKTEWALLHAWHWARWHKVGFFSLEDSLEALTKRLNALRGKPRMPDDERNMEFVPAAGMKIGDILDVIMDRGYEIVFIDYLQLIRDFNVYLSAPAINALRAMARSKGVTVVALSSRRLGQQSENPPSDISSLENILVPF